MTLAQCHYNVKRYQILWVPVWVPRPIFWVPPPFFWGPGLGPTLFFWVPFGSHAVFFGSRFGSPFGSHTFCSLLGPNLVPRPFFLGPGLGPTPFVLGPRLGPTPLFCFGAQFGSNAVFCSVPVLIHTLLRVLDHSLASAPVVGGPRSWLVGALRFGPELFGH